MHQASVKTWCERFRIARWFNTGIMVHTFLSYSSVVLSPLSIFHLVHARAVVGYPSSHSWGYSWQHSRHSMKIVHPTRVVYMQPLQQRLQGSHDYHMNITWCGAAYREKTVSQYGEYTWHNTNEKSCPGVDQHVRQLDSLAHPTTKEHATLVHQVTAQLLCRGLWRNFRMVSGGQYRDKNGPLTVLILSVVR